MGVAPVVISEDEVRSALRAVLASNTFSRSQQLSRLLKYLCDSLLTHGPDYLAEYTIGTEALGRAADFDPTQDAAVRVEMHRLRRRLREYYDNEGTHDPVRVVIPSGQYAPVITRGGEEHKDPPPVREPAALEPPPDPPPPTVASEPPNDSRPFHFTARQVAWVSVAGMALLLFSAWLLWRPANATANGHPDMLKSAVTIPPPSLPAPPTAGIRIRCGRRSPWTDRVGQIWAADQYFEGGQAVEFPAHSYIARAFDPRLYESARSGTFSYRIPLPARTYEMHLYFMEPVFGPDGDGGEASRLFRVYINGQKVFDRFDILADADGQWTADMRVFKDISPGPDGNVLLNFESISGPALLNGIELVPARPHILNPIRLLPQDNFYTDSIGNVWTPDNFVTGGRISLHPGPVKNTRDQEIFRHERFGHFRYVIPVDRGSYSVYLYMSEEYWGPGNPGGGGDGTRVFSVFCNGTALLRNFDLYKEAGINTGVVRAFHHLTPNGQGKLALSFEPEHDYASLYALEVLDESGPDTPAYSRTLITSAGN